jgi:S-adenosyl-L-methionine hydrolase (adenosine-forming)
MPIITLTTDFGLDNYLNAVAKGLLLKSNPHSTVLELSCCVDAFNMMQTAYIVKSSFPNFARGTHHVILSGLYNQSINELLIVYYQSQYFYFFDNGLAPLLFETKYKVHSIKLNELFVYNLPSILDSFAIAINAIDKKIEMATFTKNYDLQINKREIENIIHENEIIAQVIYIDSFKNVVVNITKVEFEKIRRNRNFTIGFVKNESIQIISTDYRDVNIGRKVAFFNSAGFLEIAVRGGKASDLFGFELGENANDVYKTVIIKFE